MHNWLYKIFTSGKKDYLDDFTKRLAVILLYFSITILIAMGVLLAIDYLGHKSSNSPYLGTFGDFFGGVVNPMLTFFTVVGLSITIIMQRISLNASRVQGFETTFFNMLELHNSVVQQLRFNPSIVPDRSEIRRITFLASGKVPDALPIAEGRAVFAAILAALKAGVDEDHNMVKVYKETLQDKHNYVLGHYFRNLYQILRLIDRAEHDVLTVNQSKAYAAIIRAQLSAHELELLVLNCQPKMVDEGEFQKLVIKYNLLEHLPLVFNKDSNTFSATNLLLHMTHYSFYFLERPASNAERLMTNQSIVITSGAYGTNPVVHDHLVQLQPGLKLCNGARL